MSDKKTIIKKKSNNNDGDNSSDNFSDNSSDNFNDTCVKSDDCVISDMCDEKTPIEMLLNYQVPHVYQLYEALKTTDCVLDASDTGTGKTYVALAVCHLMKKKAFIICPKSVITSWVNVAKQMNVEIDGLSNYEKIKGCRYYTSKLKNMPCTYIKKYFIDEEKKSVRYKVEMPEDVMIIYDEAHRCKNSSTTNCKILMAMKESNRKILLLSATIIDKVESFSPFGILFDLYNNTRQFNTWIKNRIMFHQKKNGLKPELSIKKNTDLIKQILHDTIFPKRGSRLKIKELGDLFPQNQIVAKCYYCKDSKEVDKLYEMINVELKDLQTREEQSEKLGKLIICRMKIEMYKLPIILDLIDDALENGYAIAVFVNYRDSMNYLLHHLKEECSLIHGDQTIDERQINIDNFQSNRTNILISIITAGGVGISLHDLHGKPRMSIISPSWTATDVVQALGRIHRAGSKSPALQRIVYIANTYEENICKMIDTKLETLSFVNDGNNDTYKMKDDILIEEGTTNVENSNVTNLDFDNPNEKKIKKKKYKNIN